LGLYIPDVKHLTFKIIWQIDEICYQSVFPCKRIDVSGLLHVFEVKLALV